MPHCVFGLVLAQLPPFHLQTLRGVCRLLKKHMSRAMIAQRSAAAFRQSMYPMLLPGGGIRLHTTMGRHFLDFQPVDAAAIAPTGYHVRFNGRSVFIGRVAASYRIEDGVVRTIGIPVLKARNALFRSLYTSVRIESLQRGIPGDDSTLTLARIVVVEGSFVSDAVDFHMVKDDEASSD